jgi:hypothetical protein
LWSNTLRRNREARASRVEVLLEALAQRGIHVPREDLIVHRITHTFFCSLDLATLARLADLHRVDALCDLRRIMIQ